MIYLYGLFFNKANITIETVKVDNTISAKNKYKS